MLFEKQHNTKICSVNQMDFLENLIQSLDIIFVQESLLSIILFLKINSASEICKIL